MILYREIRRQALHRNATRLEKNVITRTSTLTLAVPQDRAAVLHTQQKQFNKLSANRRRRRSDRKTQTVVENNARARVHYR